MGKRLQAEIGSFADFEADLFHAASIRPVAQPWQSRAPQSFRLPGRCLQGELATSAGMIAIQPIAWAWTPRDSALTRVRRERPN
jgi:hypothetical protein